MILSDAEILAARACGDIVIEPFNPRCLGTDSYDVTLGAFFYVESSDADFYPEKARFNPFDEKDVNRVWGEPQTAQVWKGVSGSEAPIILLSPGETILAHTQEFIGARRKYTTKMYARSSTGRAMIGVCKCAGKGDVGFFNRWTMEITSFSRNHIIPLRVGMRLAQIEFLRVGETLRRYGGTHGKYQTGDDLQAIMRSWRPEMMLPRFYDDWEIGGVS